MSDKQIEELVRASLQARIVQAFQEAPEAIDALVAACLQGEVNEYGVKPSYGDRKMPYLTHLAESTIRRIAQNAVQEHIETLKPMIEQKVREALTADVVVAEFVRFITKGITDAGSVTVDVRLNQ